jgi:hypothetical protein
MRLEPYREAWHLLQSDASSTGVEIQAMADETAYSSDAHVGTAAPGCPAGQSPATAETFANLTWLTPRPTKPVNIRK